MRKMSTLLRGAGYAPPQQNMGKIAPVVPTMEEPEVDAKGWQEQKIMVVSDRQMIVTLHILSASAIKKRGMPTGGVALFYEMSLEELTGSNHEMRMGKWKLNQEEWEMIRTTDGQGKLLSAGIVTNMVPDLTKLLDVIKLDLVKTKDGAEDDWVAELTFDDGHKIAQTFKPGKKGSLDPKSLSDGFKGSDSLDALKGRDGKKKTKVQNLFPGGGSDPEGRSVGPSRGVKGGMTVGPGGNNFHREVGRKASAVDLKAASADVDVMEEGDTALVLRDDGNWMYAELKRKSSQVQYY
jgi:hypothetical protein